MRITALALSLAAWAALVVGDQTPEHNVRLFAINADLDDDFPALGFWAGERIGSANKTNNANSLRILPTIFA
jgi:hypothetical protein